MQQQAVLLESGMQSHCFVDTDAIKLQAEGFSAIICHSAAFY